MEDKITEEQLGDKVSKLDKIVSGTFPNSLSAEGQDLKVSLREKEKLGLVLQQLNSEVEQLEEKITEERSRMTTHMATINRGEGVGGVSYQVA